MDKSLQTNQQHGSQNFKYAPIPITDHVRSIAIDIILTLVTCGLWNLFVQYKQINSVNQMINVQKYSFLPWLLLTFITFGLYHIYHEFRKSEDIDRCIGVEGSNLPLITLVLTIFGLSIVADAIQQASINRYFGEHGL